MLLYFTLAVLSLIILTNLLVMGVMLWATSSTSEPFTPERFIATFDWQLFTMVGVGVVIVVAGGSLYKMLQLNQGGRGVAEALGGRLLSQNSSDPSHHKILNVVEEMAIASGTPVPSVYLLESESGINAFAAGQSTSDAVIGVTRGCVEQLTREQLQGVVAHEFSHILHGDMRINLRLIGVLHGILLIGIIGYYLLRSMAHRRSGSSRGNGAPVVLILGGGLMLIGYAGTFFGNLIKASVSRQREYLADASAVQFTRNPYGIAGALKKIGGFTGHSYVENASAREASHLFFSSALRSFMGSLLATHPPLGKRIRRIEPGWDGTFNQRTTPPEAEQQTQDQSTQQSETLSKIAAVTATAEAMQSLNTIGQIDERHLGYAVQLLHAIPTPVHQAINEPYGARAVLYALLIDHNPQIEQRQLSHLELHGDRGIHELTRQLLPQVRELDRRMRLPLIDLAIPSLRQLSLQQYLLFKSNLTALIEADQRVNLFEWALQHILLHHLDATFTKQTPQRVKYGALEELKTESELVLSLLVYAERTDNSMAQRAFEAANRQLGCNDLTLLPKEQLSLKGLNGAIEKLAQLRPTAKPQLLKACVAAVMADDQVTAQETELVRAFAAALDCPLPPMLQQQ